MELLLETAGESHGSKLTAILVGLPAGAPADAAYVDARLAARQRGYGRSARQRTERDRVRFTAGVRDGRLTGNPVALEVDNLDATYRDAPPVHAPRPGHADLAGALNRGLVDARDVVERASARETAVRTAAGALAAQFLEALGIRVLGHVRAVGGIDVGGEIEGDLEAARALRDGNDLHALGAEGALARARAAIDDAKAAGDTLGGVVEVVADGVPAGLGGHERPEEKISSRLAAAVIGVQAVRAVELGMGAAAASRRGSEVHDAIFPSEAARRSGEGGRSGDADHGKHADRIGTLGGDGTRGRSGEVGRGGGVPRRRGNAAGGIEGGTTNGERLVVRASMKPLATLRTPLPSVDLRTGEAADARVERSDVTAVPALSIVLEAVVALEIARAVRRRYGGAHLEEVAAAMAFHASRMRPQARPS